MGISNHKSSTHLSAIKILKEGIKLPSNNFNLIHPILILSFVSSSLFYFFNYFSFTPLLTNINTNSLNLTGSAVAPDSSALIASTIKSLKEFYIILFLSATLSFLVNSLLAIAKIHVLSAAYTSKSTPPTLKEAVSTMMNPQLIKRSMITQLYVALFTVCYIVTLLLIVGVLSFFYIYSERKTLTVASGAIVALVAFLSYLYLAMVWMVSVVISVVEEGCYGLEGIAKAGKLLRGRRMEAVLVVFMEFFAAGVIYVVYDFATGYFPMARLGVGVGRLVIGVVGNLLMWSVHTVYYYECCNKIDSEEIAMNGGFMYAPVGVTTTLVDAYL